MTITYILISQFLKGEQIGKLNEHKTAMTTPH